MADSPDINGQVPFEGMVEPPLGQEPPVDVMGLGVSREVQPCDAERIDRIEKATTRRAAFRSAMFPGYHGLDESELNDTYVPPDAYRESKPAALRAHIHDKTPQSMRQGKRAGRWVLLSAVEFSTIINFPEEFAQGADVKNRTTLTAQYRELDARAQAASRAGAHALNHPLVRMNHLFDGYGSQILVLRSLVPMIKNDWHANRKGYDVRQAVMTARDGVHGILQATAEAKNWSEEDLRLARIGLDQRLLAGRGKKELDRKKAAWTDLTKVLGNYTIAKRVLVRNRIGRAKIEIERRELRGSAG